MPHKISVNQGNMVDQAMIDKLRPGMTRSQVRFVLGTALVQDAMHPDRWDYIYMSGTAGNVRPGRRVTLLFKDDKLVQIETEDPPTAAKSRSAEAGPTR